MTDALKTATRLLKRVFEDDMVAVATLITAEAENNPEPAICGLESLSKFCNKLLDEIKGETPSKTQHH